MKNLYVNNLKYFITAEIYIHCLAYSILLTVEGSICCLIRKKWRKKAIQFFLIKHNIESIFNTRKMLVLGLPK